MIEKEQMCSRKEGDVGYLKYNQRMTNRRWEAVSYYDFSKEDLVNLYVESSTNECEWCTDRTNQGLQRR